MSSGLVDGPALIASLWKKEGFAHTDDKCAGIFPNSELEAKMRDFSVCHKGNSTGRHPWKEFGGGLQGAGD